MSKDKANQKGITLIALVITIIVMLILVGLSVTVALNGGLFSTAQKAVGDTESERDNELALSDEKVEINGELYNSIDEYLEESKGHGNSGANMLEGDGQTYYTLAPSTLSFRSSADINDFQEVQINGVTLDQSNYSITEGSTIITLSIDYLKNLAEDDYSISIVSKTGSSSARFSVVEPDVNSHGFYYDQPYTAYVSSWDTNVSFVIRENGTFVTITEGGNASVSGGTNTSTCSYVIDGNKVTAFTEFNGTLTATISPGGAEIYCNELACTFTLGNEAVIADEEYLYIFNNSLDGYMVGAIDDTKESYGSIRLNINNKPIVFLAARIFEDNTNLVVAPEIPISVTNIGNYAFRGCTSLSSITIPSSVTLIGERAFEDCTSLTDITFEGTVEQWNKINFGENWNLMVPATSVTCTDGTASLN